MITNRHNSTSLIGNFFFSLWHIIRAVVYWIWCVIYGLCISIMHYILSAVYWIWCVIYGLCISIMHYILSVSVVKVHVLVAGETFNTHETFIQNLKLRIKLCSAENSDVILVFCPVASRIGTDMEAAMARVTVNKPVILVFMHHCHHPSQMTNMTVQPCRRNMRVVHCAFLENGGLLQCSENNQAVSEVHMILQKYQQGNGPSKEEIFKSV